MENQYKAAFIIPIDSTKIITDLGWEFESKTFLPNQVVEFLKESLKLQPDESYLGIESYTNESLQARVVLDDQGRIEHVYIKIYGNGLEFILSEFNKSRLKLCAVLFIP